MAPYESHKIGDYFIKEFLKSALKRFSLNKDIASEINEIVFADFNNAEIRREYKNIDILVISPKNKFLWNTAINHFQSIRKNR